MKERKHSLREAVGAAIDNESSAECMALAYKAMKDRKQRKEKKVVGMKRDVMRKDLKAKAKEKRKTAQMFSAAVVSVASVVVVVEKKKKKDSKDNWMDRKRHMDWSMDKVPVEKSFYFWMRHLL